MERNPNPCDLIGLSRHSVNYGLRHAEDGKDLGLVRVGAVGFQVKHGEVHGVLWNESHSDLMRASHLLSSGVWVDILAHLALRLLDLLLWLLNSMRQSSVTTEDEEGSHMNNMSHAQRMRKEEDKMDEDERLLASEKGKKLSSKERRQLRNKVCSRFQIKKEG